ncbi:MAG: hypothetical protein R2852_07255 [Bacteroidia bacterium]
MSSFDCTPSNSGLTNIHSNDSNSYVLYLFTGSDWCANCRRLDKKVLSDSVFISSITEHNIQIKIIDFPQRTKLSPETILYNDSIAQVMMFDGAFPGIVLQSRSNLGTQKLSYKNETSAEFLRILLESKAKLE